MAFLSYLNFAATIATFGCVSFAASSFGVKLGKIAGIQNTLGYQYVSSSQHKDKIYEAIAKASASVNDAPEWAKDKAKLEKWCSDHEKSTRYWKDTSKYCLIKNTVRHQLINNGLTLKTNLGNDGCTEELLDSYTDSSKESVNYLFAKSKCTNSTTQPAAAAAAAAAAK